MRKVDLRRDTITLPDAAMRDEAFEAPLGDSVYGEDPSQAALESFAAQLLGKEEAIFVPSGTMGNLVAVLSHTERGDEIIMEENAHIRTSETGGAACVGGLMIRGVRGDDGAPDPQGVEAAIRPRNIHYPATALICIESTHYRYGGIVPPLESFEKIRKTADRHGIPVHLDGARVFNAASYLGVDAGDIAGYADTVMISLSKGLGAPVGSMLCGSRDFMIRAKRYRKMLGGGMRQTGWLCACGLVALSPANVAKLKVDHENARYLAENLAALPGLRLDLDRIHTNYVTARLESDGIDAPALIASLNERDVLADFSGKEEIRFVVSREVSREDIEYALEIINELLAGDRSGV
jgi:threonine aldolase